MINIRHHLMMQQKILKGKSKFYKERRKENCPAQFFFIPVFVVLRINLTVLRT
jgi:hypothetical protein